MPFCLKKILVCSAALMLASCATTHEQTFKPESTQLHNAKLPDFSGHWEKNYQASDVFSNRFQLYVADIRRGIVRNTNENAGFKEASGLDAKSINGLAQLAEEITRMPLLNIKQDDASVNVERENDFNLRCLYHEKQFVQRTNAFGSERCGWTNDRMVFQMYMAGGLQVSHLFSLSPDGTQLNVTSTIGSDRVTSPIVISNYYTRFVSQDDHYDCKQTLTRNKVCSQQGHSK